MMSKEDAGKLGLVPLAKIVSWAQTGVDPSVMGTGPISAVKKAVSQSHDIRNSPRVKYEYKYISLISQVKH
jgi:hypothetical protein